MRICTNSTASVAQSTDGHILLISAAPVGLTGPVLRLTHDLFTTLGNHAIFETVLDEDFTVAGMAGGKGGDCGDGEACRSDEDCESNVCESNLCEGP